MGGCASTLNSFIDSSTQEGDKEKLVWILRAGCAAAGLSKQPDHEEQPQQITDSESEDDEHETVTCHSEQQEEHSISTDIYGESNDVNIIISVVGLSKLKLVCCH